MLEREPPVRPPEIIRIDRHHLLHGLQGNAVRLRRRVDEESTRGRDGERNNQGELTPLPEVAVELYLPAEPANVVPDDIQPNAATGDFSHLGSGAEAGLENEVHRLPVGQKPGPLPVDDTLGHRHLADPIGVDATSVIRNLQLDG